MEMEVLWVTEDHNAKSLILRPLANGQETRKKSRRPEAVQYWWHSGVEDARARSPDPEAQK